MDNAPITVTAIRAVLKHLSDDLPHHEYPTTFYHHELIYFLAGENKLHFDGVDAVDRAGSIRFLPAGERGESSKYTVDYLTDSVCIDIYFHSDRPLSTRMFIRDFSQDAAMRSLFERIYRVWYNKREGYEYEAMGVLYEILARMEKANTSYLPEEQYERIRPALDYIDGHFTDAELDCAQLAEKCGVSYSYFKRLFLRKFGMPPVKYVAGKKLSRACDLLQSGLWSVTEVAALSGYSNVYYFSRVFKRSMGVSPSEYGKTLTR